MKTYRPRRPEAPVSQCHHLVDPLEALKTLRLRADSVRECRTVQTQANTEQRELRMHTTSMGVALCA